MSGYPRLQPNRKTGLEVFHKSGQPVGASLLEFWQWYASDLISNSTRGCLAEFIVANALGLAENIRDEWCPFDLETKSKTKVEVKSAAYLQTWFHKEHSKIIFSIRPSRAWNADTNEMAAELRRQADIYVFCLLSHKEKDEQFDPMNLDLWDFYVVSARVLDERFHTAKQINLKSLEQIQPVPFKYDQIADAVEDCRLNSSRTSPQQ